MPEIDHLGTAVRQVVNAAVANSRAVMRDPRDGLAVAERTMDIERLPIRGERRMAYLRLFADMDATGACTPKAQHRSPIHSHEYMNRRFGASSKPVSYGRNGERNRWWMPVHPGAPRCTVPHVKGRPRIFAVLAGGSRLPYPNTSWNFE